MRSTEKIVLLVPGFPGGDGDSSSVTYLQDLVLSYKEYYPGAKVQVIAFQFPFREGNYKWNGVEVYSAGGKNKGGVWKFFTWRRVLKKLQEVERADGIKVLHSFWLSECAFIGQRFAGKRGIKHVATIMGRDVQESNRYTKKLKFDRMKVVAISKGLNERYHKLAGRYADHLIPFGIDVRKLQRTSTDRGVDVIGVGSLIPLKNYSLFIDIVAALKKEIPGIRAIIIGQGEEEKMLLQKIETLGLTANVVLAGDLPHAEVFRRMQQSRVFLHTSSYEGQSLVMMEALYAGLPVVCFDTGRPYDGDRLNVCRDSAEMTNVILRLLSERSGYEPVLVRTTEETARQYVEIYMK
jgi:glycosyltransferase involved in cell wall biosynthesis